MDLLKVQLQAEMLESQCSCLFLHTVKVKALTFQNFCQFQQQICVVLRRMQRGQHSQSALCQRVDIMDILGLTSENFCQPRLADTAPAARRQSAEAQIVIEDDAPSRYNFCKILCAVNFTE